MADVRLQREQAARATPPSPARDGATPTLPREMTRVAGALYASGGVLVLVALVALDERVAAPGAVAFVAASSIVFGIGLALVGERVEVPPAAHAVTSALGTLVVSVIVALGGEVTAAPFGIFYVYVAAFAFYYLPIGWAAAEVALAGIGYAVALRIVGLPEAVGVWVLVIGASVIAAALIGRLGHQQRRRATSLAAYDVARATMLRIVSHDLRAPLATIISSADSLLERLPQLSPDRVRELASLQQRQAQKLLDLVDDVLTAERVAAGELRLDRQRTELRNLVEDVVGTLADGDTRISITGGPAEAAVDAPLLQRAVENLVGNALRHSRGPVLVELVTDRVEGIEIHVCDRGDGVPQELLASVFDPFVQCDGDGGTAGLGLSLAQAVVRAHGGEVTVANRRRGGARFTISLPHAVGD